MRVTALAIGFVIASLVLVPAGAASAAVPSTMPAVAADAPPAAPVTLGMIAVGQSVGFYDLTLEPGASVELSVQVVNPGSAAIDARSYAADAYTIVNGGFGARTADQPRTGTTRWLNYPTVTSSLAGGAAMTRDFSLTVPAGTLPGQYITSLVVENAVPAASPTSDQLRETIRTAVAVSIRVPGRLHPALAFDKAADSITAHGSAISVAITNSGNERLTPTGWLIIRDAGGAVWRQLLSMDSFYALTTTSVETKVPDAVPDGHYTVEVSLQDAKTHARATTAGVPLVLAAQRTHQAVVAVAAAGSLTALLIYVAITAMLTSVCTVIVVVMRLRRHPPQPRTRGDRARGGSILLLLLVLLGTSVTSAAWAVWSFSSTPGGAGGAAATTVGAGVTPTVTASGSSMIVRWGASTLGTGTAVSGYLVTRYSAGLQAQTTLGNCSGVIANAGCIENNVPAGTWTYTVTPVYAANWKGAESSRSSGQVSNGTPSGNNIWMWVTP